MNAGEVYLGSDVLRSLEGAHRYNRALAALLASVPISGGRVLDFGAGSGEFARRLREMGADVVCIEPDAVMCERLIGEGFVAFRTLEEVTDSFDSVVMMNVLEHVEDDGALLTQLAQRMAPEGRLFVFVPALQILYSKFDALIGHFRRYSHDSLERAVSNAGFEVLYIRWFDSLGVLAAMVFKMLRRTEPTATAVGVYDRYLFPISQIGDRVLHRFIGKNLYCVAQLNHARAAQLS